MANRLVKCTHTSHASKTTGQLPKSLSSISAIAASTLRAKASKGKQAASSSCKARHIDEVNDEEEDGEADDGNGELAADGEEEDGGVSS